MRPLGGNGPQRIRPARRHHGGSASTIREVRVKCSQADVIHPAFHQLSAKKLAAGKLSRAGKTLAQCGCAGFVWRRAGRTAAAWAGLASGFSSFRWRAVAGKRGTRETLHRRGRRRYRTPAHGGGDEQTSGHDSGATSPSRTILSVSHSGLETNAFSRGADFSYRR